MRATMSLIKRMRNYFLTPVVHKWPVERSRVCSLGFNTENSAKKRYRRQFLHCYRAYSLERKSRTCLDLMPLDDEPSVTVR